jgi:hypothetical protein
MRVKRSGSFRSCRLTVLRPEELRRFADSFPLIGKTALGPVFVGGSFGDSGHRKWWFGLGRIS